MRMTMQRPPTVLDGMGGGTTNPPPAQDAVDVRADDRAVAVVVVE